MDSYNHSIPFGMLLLCFLTGCASTDDRFDLQLSGIVRDAASNEPVPVKKIEIIAIIDAPVLPECLSDPMSCFMHYKVYFSSFTTDKQGHFNETINLSSKIDAVNISSKWNFDYELRCDNWLPKHKVYIEPLVVYRVTETLLLDCDGQLQKE